MRKFLISLLMLAPIYIMAQKNFKRGYVVTKSSDTIRGEVDYRESNKNPMRFNFKVESGEIKTYDVSNCIAYGIDNIDAFESYFVNISQSKIATTELTVGVDSSSIRDTVFLRVLQKGKHVTLYSYTDKRKQRFYVKASYNEVPFELQRQMYYSPLKQTTVVTDKIYMRQLSEMIKNLNGAVPNMDNKLSVLGYNDSQMRKIVAGINGQDVRKSTTNLSAVRFFAGLGIVSTYASYGGDHRLARSDAEANRSYFPSFTAGLDLLINREVGKIILRTDASLFTNKNHISIKGGYPDGTNYDQTFNAVTFAVTPQVLYNIYNTPKFKAYISTGVSLNYSSYTNNFYKMTNVGGNPGVQYIQDDIELADLYPSIPLNVGIVINKKFEIHGGYSFKSPLTTTQYYSISIDRYRFGINYLFGKY